MAVLQVFVEVGCWACRRATELADQARAQFPALTVEIVTLSDAAAPPESVFAVPTFVLDGRILSLGNPRAAVLMRELAAHLAAAEG